MARYLSLINFTDKGIQNVKETISRAEAFRATVKAAGGNVEALYWAVGEADGAVIFNAPDEATAATLLLKLGGEDNVRTRTLSIFNEEEFQDILAATM